jgi:hypothetical protein
MSKFTAFQSDYNNGFTMTFENGCTISVQFGRANYATIRDGFSISAEIAIWDKDGTWYNFGHDQVKGYCNANEVAEWIDKASKFDEDHISYLNSFKF